MNTIRYQFVFICVLFFFFTMNVPVLFSAENMIGRQSQNEGFFALPVTQNMVIDACLDDWDTSGQIWSFADIGVRNRFSVKSAAMWDKEFLYLSFYWKDPMPLNSKVNPDFNPDKGWVADAVQLRVTAEQQTSWLTLWHYSADQRSVLHLSYWKDETNSRNGQETKIFVSKSGETGLGENIQMCYKILPEKDGFIQEIRIPWTILYKKHYVPVPGESIKMGMDFMWGDITGEGFPLHKYVDNMSPGSTSREFFWTAKTAWGTLTLLEKGGLKPRRYIEGENKQEGIIPVRTQLTKDIGNISGFTLVIEDSNGYRIRNLAGDFNPQEYVVKDAVPGTVEVLWDGLDETGVLVSPGTYTIRGLIHGPLGADYESCFYNPGTPPWQTVDGIGAWGADHAAAEFVTQCGDWTILGWAFAEGGSGIVGIDSTGRKRWGEKRGVTAITSNEEFVYAIPDSWHTKEQTIMRLNGKNGEYAPFVKKDSIRTLELPIREIFSETVLADSEKTGKAVAMTADTKRLAVLFERGHVALLDNETAEVIQIFEPTELLPPCHFKESPFEFIKMKNQPVFSMVFRSKYLICNLDGAAFMLDSETSHRHVFSLSAMERIGAMAVDKKNELLWIVDRGTDQQIKAFDQSGKFVRAIGMKGGRPVRGKFVSEGLMNVTGIAVDRNDQIWATEYSEWPRRVSVWSAQNGKYLRDYIGNTGYAGTGGFLHDQDPGRGFVGPNELIYVTNSKDWIMKNIIWLADPLQGESFLIATRTHTHPSVFRSKASGQEREYMFVPAMRNYNGYFILMREEDIWRPVTAIGTVGTAFGVIGHSGPILISAEGDFAEYNLFDGLIWNDKNNDAKVQRNECEVVKTNQPGNDKRAGEPGIPLRNGWGARMDPIDMTFYVFSADGVVEYKPTGFSQEGAPQYALSSMRKIGYSSKNGEIVPVPGADNALLLMPNKLAGISRKDGREHWTYDNPYHFVHGSHRAVMPKPGLIIGPLKILGIVDADKPDIGFFGLRGNLGQDFYMTLDGLYIGSMFLDGRLPVTNLPNTEDELSQMPLEMFSNGGEPFNGWLGRQSDGVIRMTCGLAREAVMVTRLRGFETVRRLDAGSIVVTDELLQKAETDNIARKQEAAKKLEYTIKRKPVTEWKDIPEISVIRSGQPASAKVSLVYDDHFLYAKFVVADSSPWKNSGQDFSRLFKTGDCLDIQLSPSANSNVKVKDGDLRILIAPYHNQATAVLMRELDSTASESDKAIYQSPVMRREFARVEILKDAHIKTTVQSGRYITEAAISWQSLGMKPESAKVIRGDVGFILSDDAGLQNTARVYWSNQNTNLVNDIPGEAVLEPNRWATLKFE